MTPNVPAACPLPAALPPTSGWLLLAGLLTAMLLLGHWLGPVPPAPARPRVAAADYAVPAPVATFAGF